MTKKPHPCTVTTACSRSSHFYEAAGAPGPAWTQDRQSTSSSGDGSSNGSSSNGSSSWGSSSNSGRGSGGSSGSNASPLDQHSALLPQKGMQQQQQQPLQRRQQQPPQQQHAPVVTHVSPGLLGSQTDSDEDEIVEGSLPFDLLDPKRVQVRPLSRPRHGGHYIYGSPQQPCNS